MSNNKKEIRSLQGLQFEKREDGKDVITGYAAVFNEQLDAFWYIETIRNGAFSRTLKDNGDVRALLDHDTGRVIGRTKAGNLTLREDKKGLKIELEPINTQDGKDAIEWVRSGVVDGMSIGFFVVQEKWTIKDKRELREILDIELLEVSLVTFPAYPQTSAEMKSQDANLYECRSFKDVHEKGQEILLKRNCEDVLKTRTNHAKRVVKLFSSEQKK